MLLRSFFCVLVASICLSTGRAQKSTTDSDRQLEVDTAVFPISTLKIYGPMIKGWLGTGFCLDRTCRFVGTNYHVAVLAKPRSINGERIINRYLATGPNDEDATINRMASGNLLQKYALTRDLAVFELRHPLGNRHGVGFDTDYPEEGQAVDIYSYPKDGINPIRSLAKVRGTFTGETTTGLLAFRCDSQSGVRIGPGGSGGLVVDHETGKIVGILSGIDLSEHGMVLAVPVQSLIDFVTTVRPSLAEDIFGVKTRTSTISEDVYPKFGAGLDLRLHFRTDDSPAVQALRDQAELLVKNVQNAIAVQTFEWGSGQRTPRAEAAYEVRILDGRQEFFPFGDHQRKLAEVPLPWFDALSPGGEWFQLPRMLARNPSFPILQAPDALVEGQPIKIFQYRASAEDGVCGFTSFLDLGFFARKHDVMYACYGEVWTDPDGNILRISEHYEDGKASGWKHYEAVVTYGWLRQKGNSPRLVPLTISAQAESRNKIYWCRGRFVDYRIFSSEVKINADQIRSAQSAIDATDTQ